MKLEYFKRIYFEQFALRFGSLDCHFLMKKNNVVDFMEGFPNPVHSIMELGCANGILSMYLARRFPSIKRIEGFDISKKSIHYARALSGRVRDVTSRFYVGDLRTSELNGNYDLVLYIDCLQYVEDKDHMLKEIKKSLNILSGKIILYVPLMDGYRVRIPIFLKRRQPLHNHMYPSSSDLKALLDRQGLRIESSKWVGGRPIRYYMAVKYWLKSFNKLLAHMFWPLDLLFALLERAPKSSGYGLFLLLGVK